MFISPLIYTMDNLGIDIDSVLGLGRVSLVVGMDDDQKFTLPQIHFILYNDISPEKEKGVTAICLEFALSYSALNREDAFSGLRQLCINYAQKIIQEKEGEEIIEAFLRIVQEKKLEDLWAMYRAVNFRTALRGRPTVDAIKVNFINQLHTKNYRLERENKHLKSLLSKHEVDYELDEQKPVTEVFRGESVNITSNRAQVLGTLEESIIPVPVA